MKKSAKILYVLTLLNIVLVGVVLSGTVTIPKSFTSGDVLTAADLNAMMSAVQTAVDGNDATIAALELDLGNTKIALTAANDKIVLLEEFKVAANSKITTLEGKTASMTDDGATVLFSGRNLQLVNGTSSSIGTLNGLGNLIIGYNEDVGFDGTDTRTGSHNLVIGIEHTYSSFGGMVVGNNNTISGAYATVSGGVNNIASAPATSVSGGKDNTASAQYSSISGGSFNAATLDFASVSGGSNNIASGGSASVSGGLGNTASGMGASVSGGKSNIASGDTSSVSGGSTNTASSWYSSVSGGGNNTASGQNSSVSGGYINTTSSLFSSVSGGNTNTASGQFSSVSGGYGCDTGAAYYQWTVGTLGTTIDCSLNSN